MRRQLFSTVFLILFFTCAPLMADFPVSTSNNWELSPAVAYNTISNEYLVVWTQVTAIYPFFGPVHGQRISQRGTLLGEPFIIVDNGGVRPSVAYNPDKNEYCVVAEAFLNTEIRVVTADGQVKTSMINSNIAGFTYPQVLYNTIDKTYLLVGIDIAAVTPGSDQCHRKIMANKFTPFGILATPWYEIRQLSDDLCTAGEGIAIDFAPITKPKTPKGRYLIALGDNPASLKMLNHEGKRICVVYNLDGQCVSDGVPFQQSKVGSPHSVDVSFGYWHDQPVFLVVWSDSKPDIDVPNWTWDSGIVGGIVYAEDDHYGYGASNEVFPISWIYWHNDLSADVNSWLPKAAYNPKTKKFVVVWRETPTGDQLNDTIVPHIRAACFSSAWIPPENDNVALSSAISTANPMAPVVATSSSSAHSLSVWQDSRQFNIRFEDIYGTLFDSQYGTPIEHSGIYLPFIPLLLLDE